MEETNYKSVVNDLKLSNGLIFGLPVVFDTNDVRVVPGAKVLLQYKNVPIAVFDVCATASVIRIKPALCSDNMQCLL